MLAPFPRAVAESPIPKLVPGVMRPAECRPRVSSSGTLKTSLFATRLFPTADCPRRNPLASIPGGSCPKGRQGSSSVIALLASSPNGSGSGGQPLFQRPRMSGTSEERTGSLGASAGKGVARCSRGGPKQAAQAQHTETRNYQCSKLRTSTPKWVERKYSKA